jgi:hypothetical protein
MLNSAVAGALLFVALGLTALLAAAWTIIPQINRTLGAFERLADTLDTELEPTLKEVQKVMVGVGELKQIAGQRVHEVSTKVEDVTGNLGKTAASAKKYSTVWGSGLWAGVKAYLEGKEDGNHHDDHQHRAGGEKAAAGLRSETHKAEAKQIAMERGEENVGLKR